MSRRGAGRRQVLSRVCARGFFCRLFLRLSKTSHQIACRREARCCRRPPSGGPRRRNRSSWARHEFLRGARHGSARERGRWWWADVCQRACVRAGAGAAAPRHGAAAASRLAAQAMSTCEIQMLPELTVESYQLREVLRCVLHTVLFQRALGLVRPREVASGEASGGLRSRARARRSGRQGLAGRPRPFCGARAAAGSGRGAADRKNKNTNQKKQAPSPFKPLRRAVWCCVRGSCPPPQRVLVVGDRAHEGSPGAPLVCVRAAATPGG